MFLIYQKYMRVVGKIKKHFGNMYTNFPSQIILLIASYKLKRKKRIFPRVQNVCVSLEGIIPLKPTTHPEYTHEISKNCPHRRKSRINRNSLADNRGLSPSQHKNKSQDCTQHQVGPLGTAFVKHYSRLQLDRSTSGGE